MNTFVCLINVWKSQPVSAVLMKYLIVFAKSSFIFDTITLCLPRRASLFALVFTRNVGTVSAAVILTVFSVCYHFVLSYLLQ